MHDDRNEEVLAVWVRRVQEQMRILQSKRFPSDISLASNTSSTSSWSGLSGHSSRAHQPPPAAGHAVGHAIGLAGHHNSGHHNSGHALPGHATIGGGAFQMEPPSWWLEVEGSSAIVDVSVCMCVYAIFLIFCVCTCAAFCWFKFHSFNFVYFYVPCSI